ncbi:MAG: hypothetical protein DMF70_03280 [Acidobacteria bacterium]|nr:MAG: hypothetical protein DMF70_03280 [Acidobacteriota bacterium]
MQLSKKTFSIATLILCFSAVVVVAQAPRGITPEDYYSFEFISDPNISPDGKLVAYVVAKMVRAQNRRNASIWMVATDGSSRRDRKLRRPPRRQRHLPSNRALRFTCFQ